MFLLRYYRSEGNACSRSGGSYGVEFNWGGMYIQVMNPGRNKPPTGSKYQGLRVVLQEAKEQDGAC